MFTLFDQQRLLYVLVNFQEFIFLVFTDILAIIQHQTVRVALSNRQFNF